MADIDWEAITREELGEFTTSELPPTLKLPALPHAATAFVQKANEPDVSIDELARIIETDSGLTTELLKYVNSSFVGLRSKAKTVAHTLTLLGRKQARMHIISTATQAAVRAKKSKLINQASFWNSSLQKALFAREVAKLLKADGELAFAGGLLQDYLLPVISNELMEPYLDFVSNRDDKPTCLTEYERQMFNWDHPKAAAGLAMRWHLPPDLVCCILFHHYGLKILGHKQLGRTAAAAVAVSALLPDELRQQKLGLEQLAKLGQKWTAFDLAKLAETVDQRQEEVGLGVKNSFPLARLCKPILAAV
ncbi:MAG: HDOD domain-containing protein [Planctomycetaceae bacterium]